jgi:hypothetical protein
VLAPTGSAEKVFQQVRSRLVGALGWHLDGGRIWSVEPVGVRAVASRQAEYPVEVLLELAEFPPAESDLGAFAGCGLEPRLQRSGLLTFACSDLPALVLVSDPSGEDGMDQRLVRDFLLSDEATRQTWEQEASEPPPGLISAARNWHVAVTGFRPVEALKIELEGLAANWMVASGWALDLVLGKPTRVHHDLDLLVLRSDQLAVQGRLAERGWRLDVVENRSYRPWQSGMVLELPITQVHARRDGDFLDLLLGDTREGEWFFRRQPDITLPVDRLKLVGHDGTPALAPEVVLLFKSSVGGKGPRGKDQDDFDRMLPALPESGREWLRDALKRHAPTHEWIARL